MLDVFSTVGACGISTEISNLLIALSLSPWGEVAIATSGGTHGWNVTAASRGVTWATPFRC